MRPMDLVSISKQREHEIEYEHLKAQLMLIIIEIVETYGNQLASQMLSEALEELGTNGETH